MPSNQPNREEYSSMAQKRGLSRGGQDPNAESLMQNEDEQKDDEISIGTIRSPKQLWKWFWKDPFSRWQLIFFLGMFCLSVVFMIVSLADPDASYVSAGVAGLVVAGYGAFHFKTLMALREEVDKFERHNSEFKRENAAVRIELDKLSKTKEELERARIGLEEATKKNKENLEKFDKISKNLDLMGDKSIKGLGRVSAMTKGIASKWKDELVSQERQLYLNVFEQLEMKDANEEMTPAEYDEFLATLPAKYRMKIQHNYTFDKLAGENGTLSYQEFSDLLDDMAKQFAVTSKSATKSASPPAGAGISGTGAANGVIEE